MTVLPGPIADITHATASSNTCTTGTVNSLRQVFFFSDVGRPTKQHAAPVRQRQVPSQKNQTKKPVGSRPRTEAQITILEEPQALGGELSSRDKAALATQVINNTLQGLTAALKGPTLSRPTKPKTSATIRPRVGGSSDIVFDPPDKRALKPQCANRVSTSPEETKSKRRAPGSSTENVPGLFAQAECACLCFAALKTLRSENTSKLDTPNSPDFQLENGLSVLIGKLVALGFHDLAVRELVGLTNSINGIKPTATDGPFYRTGVSDIGAFGDLFRCSEKAATGPCLSLSIAIQFHALRIIAAMPSSFNLRAAHLSVASESPLSLVNLIQRQFRAGIPGAEAKAIQQFESLTHLLLGLCPKTPDAEDYKMSKTTWTLDSLTMFELRTLSIKTRVIWWNLARHQGNVDREIWEPLLRGLVTFARSISAGPESYQTCKNAVRSLLEQVKRYENQVKASSGYQKSVLAEIYLKMAEIARVCSVDAEVENWWGAARVQLAKSSASGPQILSMECRKAALDLRAPISSWSKPSMVQQLTLIVEKLEVKLSEHVGDIEDLFLSINSLRKSIILLLERDHLEAPNAQSQSDAPIRDLCETLLIRGVQYLGQCIKAVDTQKEKVSRFEQITKIIHDTMIPYVGSVILFAKRSFNESDRWYRFDRSLEDCVSVLTNLRSMSADRIPTTAGRRVEASLLSISSVYWCQFLHLKEETAEYGTLRRLLDLSIGPLHNDQTPQVSLGILVVRLEQQGKFYEKNRDFREAAHSYLKALRTIVAAGDLTVIAEAAISQPPGQIFSEDGKWRLFGRLLVAYPKMVLRIEGENETDIKGTFDDEGFPPAERGLLLEQQLHAFDNLTITEVWSPKFSDVYRRIASAILSIYTRQAFPVRRLRVIIQLLCMHLFNPSLLSPELLDLATEPVDLASENISISYDSSLQEYNTHLTASHRFHRALCSKVADMVIVIDSLAAWSSLLQDRSDKDSLCRCIDDVPKFLQQLKCLAEYLEGHGLVMERISAMKLIAAVYEIAMPSEAASIAITITELSVGCTRLGYSMEASLALQKAQKYMNRVAGDSSTLCGLRWHLSYAEYSLSVGNVETSEEHLKQAGKKLKQNLSDWGSSRTKFEQSQQLALINADYADLVSTLALAQGQPLRALHFGRLTVKILQRAWADSHGSLDTSKTSRSAGASGGSRNDLVTSMSSLTVSTSKPVPKLATRDESISRRSNWLLIPRLFYGLSRLSELYAQQGLSPEAQYYIEQAETFANGISSNSFQGRLHAQAGHLLVRRGDRKLSTDHFDRAERAHQSQGLDLDYLDLQLHIAEKQMLDGDINGAESTIARSHYTIDHVDIVSKPDKHKGPESLVLEASMAELSSAASSLTVSKSSQRATRENITHVAMKQPPKLASKAPAKTSALLRAKQAGIVQRRALISLHAGDLDQTQELLGSSALAVEGPYQLILQTLLEAQLRLRRALESMAADLTFCVLPESTVSCPSVKPWSQPQAEASKQNPEQKVPARRTKKVLGPKTSRAAKAQASCPGFLDLLRQTQDGLSTVSILATRAASTAAMHTIVDVLSRTLLMMSSFGPPMMTNTIHSTSIVFVTELARTLASVRDSATIEIEQQLIGALQPFEHLTASDAKDQLFLDPLDLRLDIAQFRNHYIDIIPPSWTAVSISISESHNEFRISRLRSGQKPFIISIPLNRHNSRDPDEETFGFDQGKAEMLDIVNLANYSTHEAPDTSMKGAKTKWWEARAALDARLRDLLVDIESIWFGGFRGIFSNDIYDTNLVLRFQQTVRNILERHLPSRRKGNKNTMPDRVTLDVQVIEMFLTLGDPNVSNLDEELTDLLYFIVDILQFQGENNAYDEIDFDTIIVEVLDALRQYHAVTSSASLTSITRHTILVLDKALHCFPLGIPSLLKISPCLPRPLPSPSSATASFSSSRNPPPSPHPDAKYLINPTSGTHILNPSTDLTNTQSRFQTPLSALTSWDAITSRVPSESEFAAALSEKDILLYFGHGSGGQYIRPRTIKRLERCAVALLMGCSSGTMTEAGTFESYGTPLNYMHAGCPAVVATLWDVTDKDIDRFSQATLEKWGLLEEQTSEPIDGWGKSGQSPVKRGRSPAKRQQSPAQKGNPAKKGSPVKKDRQKGKQKQKDVGMEKARDKMSLDQAVAESRDTCIMKYLNGAAPVVYGVPVFLS